VALASRGRMRLSPAMMTSRVAVAVLLLGVACGGMSKDVGDDEGRVGRHDWHNRKRRE